MVAAPELMSKTKAEKIRDSLSFFASILDPGHITEVEFHFNNRALIRICSDPWIVSATAEVEHVNVTEVIGYLQDVGKNCGLEF